MRSLTVEEERALEATAEVTRRFMALEPVHPSDSGDVVFHVHAIQNIILARPAVAAMREADPDYDARVRELLS